MKRDASYQLDEDNATFMMTYSCLCKISARHDEVAFFRVMGYGENPLDISRFLPQSLNSVSHLGTCRESVCM